MEEIRILIVDDDITFALMLQTWLRKNGYEAESVTSVSSAKQKIKREPYSLILSDMRLPDEDGIALMQWLSANSMAIPVIVMTSFAEIQNAVNSMKLGACDYLSKPVNPSELLTKIAEALKSKKEDRQTGNTKIENNVETNPEDYIQGNSDLSRQLYQYVGLVAPTNMAVLICGESGTGKEHIARLIHQKSKRSKRPFVAIDCGSIPTELAVSEFFGHTKGSFTGALTDKEGAFEAANGGTLFLDEIGNLNYETQMHLLRALQEKKIKRVGSNTEISIDIRLVSATNENLEEAIAKGTFRNDLYHRISEFTIQMPELRNLKQDIMLYANFFLDMANKELGKDVAGFSDEVVRFLLEYGWPGNLRQLKNTVMRATLLSQGDMITVDALPQEIVRKKTENISSSSSSLLRDPNDERNRIVNALHSSGGNKSVAARMLGIDRKTLYNKLKSLNIDID